MQRMLSLSRVGTAVTAGIVTTAAIAILFRATSLDIDLQAQAFDRTTSGWPYAQRFPWKQLHDYGTVPGLLLTLASIAILAAGFLSPRHARWRFPALYLVTLTALGPGVITNLFGKILAGRPRPEEIVQFGGSLQFLHPFEFGTPGKGFSFLCGHCSMGYLFVAFFFLMRGPTRWIALVASSVYGLLLGITRVVDGAHFPSDVTLAGAVTFTLAAAASPLARMQVSREAWRRRGRLAMVSVFAAIALLVFFSFSTPIHRERVHTWADASRRAATHETVLPWNGASAVEVDVEKGDIHVHVASQRDRVTIRSQVKGFGFPGSDGRTEVARDGSSIVYRHRLTGFLWEAHVRFDVTIAAGTVVRVETKTGDGTVDRHLPTVTSSSRTGTPSLHLPMYRCCGVLPRAYSRFLPENAASQSASKSFQVP